MHLLSPTVAHGAPLRGRPRMVPLGVPVGGTARVKPSPFFDSGRRRGPPLQRWLGRWLGGSSVYRSHVRACVKPANVPREKNIAPWAVTVVMTHNGSPFLAARRRRSLLPLILTLSYVHAFHTTSSLESCTSNCAPTSSAMAACNGACADAGFCCDGTTYASSHGLLSCNHGCRIAWYAGTVDECRQHCTLGNAGGCTYHGFPETGTLHKCGNCQTGCGGSTSRGECERGCELALASGAFYHDLHYTPPPPPPPHPHASCSLATGMSTSFIANMARTAYWSASAVFDDEEFAYVSAGESVLHNPRGLLCVDGETAPRSRCV